MISKMLIRSLSIAALVTSVVLGSGCGAKGPGPLDAGIALDDNIYAPGERTIVTVSITNPYETERTAQIPTPQNTRIYHSLVGENGIPQARGPLPLEQDMMAAEPTVSLAGGSTYDSTLVISSMPAELGEYILIGTYKNGAEPATDWVWTNEIELLIE